MIYALDRSARSFDQDGHLRISSSVISASEINSYYGREIPGFDQLGLDPRKMYQLYRPPEELAKAAASFDGKPLMSTHRPQPADDFQPGIVVGVVKNPIWRAPNLLASIVVWNQIAIDGIESGKQRALSCGYSYEADMTPGTYNGRSYSGVMRNISGNHISLCSEGRVKNAIVGDSARNLIMDEDTTKRMTAALKFCAGKISPQDLDKLHEILSGAEEARPLGNAADAKAYSARFPNAGRLKGAI